MICSLPAAGCGNQKQPVTIIEESNGSAKVKMQDGGYMKNAVEKHDAEDIVQVYQILHDMDYFLLRYSPEDVRIYVKDTSTVNRYYGVLKIYND